MRKIVVTSGKGGVGKTTVTATLGRTLAAEGYKVVLADADVGLNNLDVVLGMERRVVYDLGDVVSGKCRAYQALVPDFETPLRLLPSSRECDGISAQAFRAAIDSLDGFDFLFIDCPAGIERGFHRAVSAAEEAIVVTTPSASAIRDADKVIGLLKTYPLIDVSLVVNRVRSDLVARGGTLGAAEIGALLRTPPVGVIPDDDKIALAQQLGRASSGAQAERAYRHLADNVRDGSKRFYDVTSKRRGFFR